MTTFPLFKSSDYFNSSLRNWHICLWNTNSSPGLSQIVPLAPVYFRFRNHFHFCRIIFPFSDWSYHFVRSVHLFRHNKICGSHYSLVRFPVRQISAFTMQRVNICQWHTHTTHPLPSPSSPRHHHPAPLTAFHCVACLFLFGLLVFCHHPTNEHTLISTQRRYDTGSTRELYVTRICVAAIASSNKFNDLTRILHVTDARNYLR